jgi:succinyl-diaminopimelate desuccinylase
MINFYEEIQKYKDDFVKDLQDLLKIPSVLTTYEEHSETPFGQAIHDAFLYMLNLGEQAGFISKNIDNHAGHLEIGKGDEILGILCHLDVVPVSDGWDHDPFSAVIKDGNIYARGANDDKGPTMAAFYAVKMLKDLGVTFNKRIRIILGLDEESGWHCVDRYFEKEEMPSIGFAPDATFPLIYGEKGILTGVIKGKTAMNGLYKLHFGDRSNVVPDKAYAVVDQALAPAFKDYLAKHGYKGDVVDVNDEHCQLTCFGKNAHAMEPNDGLNAGFILFEFLNEVLKHDFIDFCVKHLTFDSRANKLGVAYQNELMGDLTVNLGVCRYQDGEFNVTLNFRYPIEYDTVAMGETITKYAGAYGFSYEVMSDSTPHFVDPNSDFIKTLHQAYIKYTGDEKTPLLTIGGGTYARALKQAVAFGALMPYEEELAHQPNEYANIDNLLKAAAIYAEAIYHLTRE